MTRVAILGCGALGGVLAVRFSRRPDVDLTVINRNPFIAEAAERTGLVLHDRGRTAVARPRMVASAAAGAPGFDVIVLATKWSGLPEAARGLLPALAAGGVFVTLQNGLIALDLAQALGPERVVPACVLWGASMVAPGEYVLTARGATIFGSLSENDGPARAAAGLFSASTAVALSSNIEGTLWSKLAITASFTSLGAITGLRFGALARDPRARRLILAIGREVGAVAAARGVRLAPLGPVFPVPWLVAPAGRPGVLRSLMVLFVSWKNRRIESGMLAALRSGRPTEGEHINGRIIALAAATGTAVPCNRAVQDTVAELDAGTRSPGKEAFAALLDRLRSA